MKERLIATALTIASAGGAATACTPEQAAYVQRAFPCPPVETIPVAGTGTLPEGGEGGDSQTAVVTSRSFALEVPAFLTNGEKIVVCFPTAPTGEQTAFQPPTVEQFLGGVKEDQTEIKSASNIIQELKAAYRTNPKANKIYPLKYAKREFMTGEKGDPKSVPAKDQRNKEKYLENSKANAYIAFIEYMYIDLFYGTGNEVFITIGHDAARRAINRIETVNFAGKLQRSLDIYRENYLLLQQFSSQ